MNMLEQVRKQYADACLTAEPSGTTKRTALDGAHYIACFNAIMALPLPEVTEKPIAWFRDLEEEPISDAMKNCRRDDFYKHHNIPAYLIPADAEALRDENKQLREGLAASVAALEFAMKADCHDAFIKLWLHGQFDELRKEWPEAPESIYAGQMKGGAA